MFRKLLISACIITLSASSVAGSTRLKNICRVKGQEENVLRGMGLPMERVQASVVLAQRVELGERRSARAVIRQDLASGELVEQVVLGKGVRPDDPGVEPQTAAALAYLREQVGLA